MHRDAPLISPCHSDVRRKSDPRCTVSMHRLAPSNASAPFPTLTPSRGWNTQKRGYVLDPPMFDANFIPELGLSRAETEKLNDLRCSTHFPSQGIKIASTTLLDNRYRGLGRHHTPLDPQRAAKRRQARPGERACRQGARRTLTRRSPSTGDGTNPHRETACHHHQHAKTIEGMRVHERARGAGRLARRGAGQTRTGRRATSASRISGKAPPTPLTGGGGPCAQCFVTSIGELAPARSAARLRPRHQGFSPKYLSPPLRHASATGPSFHRIWDFNNPTFVLSAEGRQ